MSRFPRREPPTGRDRQEPPGERQGPEPVPALVAAEGRVADEVDAFLDGRLVDHLAGTDRPVPAWAALNGVAHADPADLAEMAAQAGTDDDRKPPDGAPRWVCDQRHLAAKLLAGDPPPSEVARVQRDVLVPLELWMIERSRGEPITSRMVLETASAILDDLRGGR